MTDLIAELGANWRGDFEVLDRMVKRCKGAGVDYVKFQALSKELLNRHPEWDWYRNASISRKNIIAVNRICKHYGIKWFCTPCYPESIEFLDEYVGRWKIRHADNDREDIVKACERTCKPIVMSVDRYKEKWGIDMGYHIDQIYCIPKYPTLLGELNFDMLKVLKGYSNHCLDVTALYRAYRYNISYLEFHLTDSSDEFSIDNKVSLTYPQMEEFCEWTRKSKESTS